MHPSNRLIKLYCKTDSLQVVILDTCTGQEVVSSLSYYFDSNVQLSGDPVFSKAYCTSRFYPARLEEAVQHCLVQAGPNVVAGINAIAIDTAEMNHVCTETGADNDYHWQFDRNSNTTSVCLKEHIAATVMHFLQLYKSSKK